MGKKTTIALGPHLKVNAAEYATQVVAMLGMRGSGKSNLAAVGVEGLLECGVQVIVLDYVGIWASLRLKPDGKTPSPFEIAVLGGKHGDVPLVPTGGALVAEALARSGSPAILDLSAMTKGKRIQFVTDFAERFFEVKKDFPGPVQIVLEEAQRYVPQVIRFKGQGLERCLGAFEEIAETGRNFGVGLCLLSLMPQKINKGVLNLAETLFGFQLNGPHERKAVGEWVQEAGAKGRAAVKDTLPGLEIGHALVWSPRWLRIFTEHVFHKKTTYDAGKTPLVARASVKLESLDLGKLGKALASVKEEAKANDPKVLRARIRELEAERGKVLRATPAVQRVEVPGPPNPEAMAIMRQKLANARADYMRHVDQTVVVWSDGIKKLREAFANMGNNMQVALAEFQKEGPALRSAISRKLPGNEKRPVAPKPPKSNGAAGNYEDIKLSRPARMFLVILAQRDSTTMAQIAILSGYSVKSSSTANALGELRSQGLAEGDRSAIRITDAGREFIGPVDPLPRGEELLKHWMGKLDRPSRMFLEEIYHHGPLDKATLSEATGYSLTSSSMANALGTLRTLGLISGMGALPMTITPIFEE